MAKSISNKIQHASILMENLASLRSEEETCDFTVKIGGESIQAHRTVLSANSDYFKAMFSSKWRESIQGCAEIDGMDAKTFRMCLDYMYTGEAEVTLDNFSRVFSAADMLQFGEISQQCIRFLERNIDAKTCLRIRSLAIEFGIVDTVKLTEKFAAGRLDEITDTEGFACLDVRELTNLLDTSTVNISKRWEAGISWIHAQANANAVFYDLLTAFNFVGASFPFLFETVWIESLVRDNPDRTTQCEQLVAKAIIDVMHPSDITTDNCFAILKLINAHGDVEQQNSLRIFISKRIEKVYEDPKFVELTRDDVICILENLNWESQYEEAWMALMAWVKSNCKKRRFQLTEMLRTSRLRCTNFKFLFQIVLGETLVKNSRLRFSLVLKALFEITALTHIDHFNWFEMLDFAKSTELPESTRIVGYVFKFMKENFTDIIKTFGFKQISKNDLIHLIQMVQERCTGPHEDASDPSEIDIWMAVTAWIQYCKLERAPSLIDILGNIDMSTFSVDFLLSTILSDSILISDSLCEDLVNTVLLQKAKMEDITLENCFVLLGLARQQNAADLHKDLQRFFALSFVELIGRPEFETLNLSEMLCLFRSKTLECPEEDKWGATLQWVTADTEERGKDLPILLREINLGKLSHDFIQNEVFNKSLVKESEECKTMIIEALLEKARNVEDSKNDSEQKSSSCRKKFPLKSAQRQRTGCSTTPNMQRMGESETDSKTKSERFMNEIHASYSSFSAGFPIWNRLDKPVSRVEEESETFARLPTGPEKLFAKLTPHEERFVAVRKKDSMRTRKAQRRAIARNDFNWEDM